MDNQDSDGEIISEKNEIITYYERNEEDKDCGSDQDIGSGDIAFDQKKYSPFQSNSELSNKWDSIRQAWLRNYVCTCGEHQFSQMNSDEDRMGDDLDTTAFDMPITACETSCRSVSWEQKRSSCARGCDWSEERSEDGKESEACAPAFSISVSVERIREAVKGSKENESEEQDPKEKDSKQEESKEEDSNQEESNEMQENDTLEVSRDELEEDEEEEDDPDYEITDGLLKVFYVLLFLIASIAAVGGCDFYSGLHRLDIVVRREF